MLTVEDSADYLRYHNEALRLSRSIHDSLGEARAFIAMGDHYDRYWDAELAYEFYTKAVGLAAKYNLHREEIVALGKQGIALESIGKTDQALKSYEEALQKSRLWGPDKEESIALEQLGIYYINRREYDRAISFFQQQQAINEKLHDSLSMASCFNNIGLVYYSKSDFTSSIIYYRKSMIIKQRLHDFYAVAQARVNIGIAYKEEGVYDLALENLLEAVRYFEKQPGEKELASCLNTIGSIQMELGNNDSALVYFRRSLVIRERIQNKSGLAGSLTNIGNVYKKIKRFDLAHDYLDRSLVIKREIGDKLMIASTLDIIGEVYALEGNYSEAEKHYRDALTLRTEVQDQKGIAVTLNHLGELYTNWNRSDSALSCLRRANFISRKIGAQQVLLRNYELMVSVFRRAGKPEEALVFYDLFSQLKDSLFNAQKSVVLTELQLKYDTEKREQKIALLDQKGKLQRLELSRRKVQNDSLIAGVLFLTAIVVLAFITIRIRNKALRQSRVIAEQRQLMMQELHHRVKNNLQSIVSILELQENSAGSSEQAAVRSISSRLNAMLLIHSDLYNKDSEGLVNMRDYLDALTEGLIRSFGFNHNFQLSFSVDEIFLEADMALSIGFIYNEILTNAFKHAFRDTADPQLIVVFRCEEESYMLRIADNGPGIPDEGLSGNESFGLKLVRFFARELQGTAEFKNGNPGIVFELILPKPRFVK